MIKGLDTVPADDRPPVNVERFSFQTMVGIGTIFALLAVGYIFVRVRLRRFPRSRWFYWAIVLAGPLALVAAVAGWITTEVGRQPWIVYGVMRTSQALTGAKDIPIGYGGAGIWILVSRRGDKELRDHARHSMGPAWEANHVWLIFILVVSWTAYPRALSSITSTHAVPLVLALIGIVLRGTAYALRAQAEACAGCVCDRRQIERHEQRVALGGDLAGRVYPSEPERSPRLNLDDHELDDLSVARHERLARSRAGSPSRRVSVATVWLVQSRTEQT